MIDRDHIGQVFPALTVEVEKHHLRTFARATGQTDPIYLNETAAQDAGYRSLPAPPTFLFSLDLEREDSFYFYEALQIDISRVLHGEQSFTYGEVICAGDHITLTNTVMDIYDKKDGALEFVILKSTATNQNNQNVGGMTRTIIVRRRS